MKKIITYLLVAIIIVGVIGVIIYFLTRGNGQAGNQAGQTGSLPSATTAGGTAGQGAAAGGSLPAAGTTSGNGALSAGSNTDNTIGAVPALDYFVDDQNNAVVIEPDGTVANIENGTTDIISSSQIQDIISASFSYNGQKLLVNFGNARYPQTSVFNINAKSWTALPAGILSPQWSPTDNRIVYLRGNSNGTATLATFDTSKTKYNITTLATLHLQDLSLLWPSKNTVLFYDHPSIYDKGSAWSFDLQKKNLTPLIFEQPGLETVWSDTTPMTGLAFIGGASQYGGQLQLINGPENTTEQLKFLTLPEKCLFNRYAPQATASGTAAQTPTTKNTSSAAVATTTNSSYLALYCAVPRDQVAFSSARLPDDYEMGSLFTSDNIYRINAATGNVDMLFNDQSKNIDASDLKIFNNALFFINRYDQKIYSIAL